MFFNLDFFKYSALLVALAMPAAATAQDDLTGFGVSLCNLAFHDTPAGIDIVSYENKLQEMAISQTEFCACVGNAFTTNSVEQSAQMAQSSSDEESAKALVSMLDHNMSICLSNTQSDEPEWNIEFRYFEFAEDPDDVRLCKEMLHGGFPAPGLNEEKLQASAKEQDLDDEQVCNCAARYMASEPEISAGIDNSQAYGGFMLGGVERCLGLSED